MPEIKVASHDASCVITLVGNGQKNGINPLALKDVIKKYGWILSPVQYPQGIHVSMTMATAKDWEKMVKYLKKSIKEMKDKPELNHNSTVATYGMSASIPDPTFMNEMIRLHSAAVLDALP